MYMKSQDIEVQRLRNQQISGTHCNSPEEVVAWMGAVQAQDYAMAKWALALRLKKATDKSIDRVIDEGRIVRTHLLRPTWHFVAVEDVRWMMQLAAPHMNKLAGSMYRQLKLDDEVFGKTNDIIGKLLADGSHLTREEIIAEVNRAGIETDNLSATHIMFRAELDMVVCNGARRGKKFTYALFDHRVPAAPSFSREEALAMLAERYFRSRGPATLQDFVWWSGLSVTDSKIGLEAVRGKFNSVQIANKEYIFPEPAKSVRVPKALLLPCYDEYTVGYADRSAVMNDELAKNPDSGNGIFKPIMVTKGKMTGVWRRTEKKDQIVIEMLPLTGDQAPVQETFEEAAADYAKFLGKGFSIL
jgi:hypothetical protein